MVPPRLIVTIDCEDPIGLGTFWLAALGYESLDGDGEPLAWLVPPTGSVGPPVYLQRVPEPKSVKNRQHFDLVYDDTEEAILRLEGLGARSLVKPYEKYGWWWQVMADPEGNEFCVVKELSSS